MARRKQAMASDPLSELVPSNSTSPMSSNHRPRQTAKIRATFHLSADLLEECRDAVVALSGPPHRLTLAELAETALREKLAQLRAEHGDFPPRTENLRSGRPIAREPSAKRL